MRKIVKTIINTTQYELMDMVRSCYSLRIEPWLTIKSVSIIGKRKLDQKWNNGKLISTFRAQFIQPWTQCTQKQHSINTQFSQLFHCVLWCRARCEMPTIYSLGKCGDILRNLNIHTIMSNKRSTNLPLEKYIWDIPLDIRDILFNHSLTFEQKTTIELIKRVRSELKNT